MAKKQSRSNQAPEQLEAFESALTRTEQFIEDNQKIITIVVLVIVGIVAIYLGFKRFYLRPLNREAQSQMFMAERYFERDSFNLALYGDGNYFGFIDIIDEYGITKSGNLANYYAGVSYLHLNDYDQAIDHLKDFNPNDELVGSVSYGALGDAYAAVEEFEQAVKNYKRAADHSENSFTTPIYLLKAGKIYEILGEYDHALNQYKKIKEEYPESEEGRMIDKYITRAELKID